jgi:hypothetical protein
MSRGWPENSDVVVLKVPRNSEERNKIKISMIFYLWKLGILRGSLTVRPYQKCREQAEQDPLKEIKANIWYWEKILV